MGVVLSSDGGPKRVTDFVVTDRETRLVFLNDDSLDIEGSVCLIAV